jgi:hypothetical protein
MAMHLCPLLCVCCKNEDFTDIVLCLSLDSGIWPTVGIFVFV